MVLLLGLLQANGNVVSRSWTSRTLTRTTRFGVRYLLRKYQDLANSHTAGVRSKRLHPHSLRHSAAVSPEGVDLSTISQWLGHASPNTTKQYATIDLEMKRDALAKVKLIRGAASRCLA